jgi:hypothetical protein
MRIGRQGPGRLESIAGGSYLKVSGLHSGGTLYLEPKDTVLESLADWRPTPPSVGFG